MKIVGDFPVLERCAGLCETMYWYCLICWNKLSDFNFACGVNHTVLLDSTFMRYCLLSVYNVVIMFE